MKSIFFLIPFLAIVILGLYQDNYSYAAGETIVGKNYFDVVNQDGTRTWSSHYDYVLDDGIYVPYIQNGLNVNSAIGDVTLNQDGSYTWNGKFDDHIIGKYADISDLTTWTYPNTLNNAVPILSFSNGEFHSNKIQTGVANMDYKYVFKDGKWKTELVVTNLSSLTTKVFGFDQIIDLNTDTVKIDDVIYNIDDFDGTVLNKLFLDYNQGKVLDLMNGVNFDFDLGYENLHSVTIHDTGINSSQLVFDYRTSVILLPNETLIIDPTFAYAGTTGDYSFVSSVGATPNCGLTWAADGVGNYIDQAASGACYARIFEWDITAIPDDQVITNVNVRYDINTVFNPPTCTWNSAEFQPTARTGQQRMDDALDGTSFVTGDTNCQTNALNYVLSLGSSANTDLQNNLVDDWWGVGVVPPTWTWDATNRYLIIVTPELEVTYEEPTSPPDAITDLSADTIGLTTASLSFSQPNLNGETLVNYMLNMTTPQQGTIPITFWMNTTSSPFAVTGLTTGTDYSASASMFTTGGGNWTQGITNILNFTTAAGASTPTGLTATDTSISTIDVNWNDAPAYDNITGFRIFRESPTGNGWTKYINDTGSSTSFLGDTGLATKTQYNYMIAGINATGVGGNSTAAAATTYGVPDAINDLALGPTSSTMTLTWSAPTVYGFPITGYKIERESPVGGGYSTIVADTGTTTTSYVNSGLSSFTQYGYKVTAITSFGNSATSNEPSAYTVTDAPVLNVVNDCYHACTTQLNLNGQHQPVQLPVIKSNIMLIQAVMQP